MKQSDIEFFKNLLIERKKQVLKNIDGAAKEIEDLDVSNARDEVDFATLNVNNLIDQALSIQQSQELFEIEYALDKIEKGAYGICEMCEEAISMQRLKIKPHAKYCIICREISEKEKNKKRSF
ncbi:MAG: RNA polymerase-binding protein DksA [Campylobacteraceae bacterium]|jgi:DnaK suppressor protein|nr:RNA polymerase-binding protein DksA [Campylobacteraceae bacterium]